MLLRRPLRGRPARSFQQRPIHGILLDLRSPQIGPNPAVFVLKWLFTVPYAGRAPHNLSRNQRNIQHVYTSLHFSFTNSSSTRQAAHVFKCVLSTVRPIDKRTLRGRTTSIAAVRALHAAFALIQAASIPLLAIYSTLGKRTLRRSRRRRSCGCPDLRACARIRFPSSPYPSMVLISMERTDSHILDLLEPAFQSSFAYMIILRIELQITPGPTLAGAVLGFLFTLSYNAP